MRNGVLERKRRQIGTTIQMRNIPDRVCEEPLFEVVLMEDACDLCYVHQLVVCFVCLVSLGMLPLDFVIACLQLFRLSSL